MLGFSVSTPVKVASVALAGLLLSAPAFAAQAQKHHRNHEYHVVHGQVDVYAEYGYESAFPNTEDHSAECINGYRWQRHNHDWYKTTGQDTLPLPCY